MRPLQVGMLLLLVLPAASVAQTETVVPGGSQDAIAAAIQSAGQNGTVILDPGSHLITTTVHVSVGGVTVLGRPGAVIRGRGAVPGGRLVLFSVTANRFALERVTIEADSSHQGDLAVVTVGSGQGSRVEDCEARGITQLVDGGGSPDLTVVRNRVTAVDVTEVGAPAGHGAVIRSAGGGTVLVDRNRLEGRRGPGTVGVEILPPAGSEHRVSLNHMTGFDEGIAGEGDGVALICKNRIDHCTNGVNVAQTVTAVGWDIRANRVDDVLAVGIFLGDGDRVVVRSNRVSRTGTDGLNLGGVFLSIRRNRSRFDGGIGLFGATASCDYASNKVKRCGAGIKIEGAGNRLRRNRASKNLSDGIVTTGGNVNVVGNRGVRNGGVQVSIQ